MKQPKNTIRGIVNGKSNLSNLYNYLAEKLAKQNRKCGYCGIDIRIGTVEERLKISESKDLATIEHCLPQSHENYNSEDEKIIVCHPCNHIMGRIRNPAEGIFVQLKLANMYIYRLKQIQHGNI